MTAQARVVRAKAYPFAAPRHSYLFVDGATRALDPHPDVAGRIAVIACGSNRAPAQLARKFAQHPNTVIPVERATLADFDVVYSAHITRYGSIPATLIPSPGTRVALALTWLDERQLAIMHGTEAPGENTDYVRLERLALVTEGGRALAAAAAYRSRHGAFVDDGAPVALAAFTAHGRRFRARDQIAVQRLVHERLAPEAAAGSLDRFILESIEDDTLRRRRIDDLRAQLDRMGGMGIYSVLAVPLGIPGLAIDVEPGRPR